VAAYSPPVPEEFFSLSYVILTAAAVYSIGVFLCSSFLSNTKIEYANRLGYYAWKYCILFVIMSVWIFAMLEVHKIQVGRELLAMNGVLLPANEKDPNGPCDSSELKPGWMKVYLGGMEVETEGSSLAVIGIDKKYPGYKDYTLLGIDRLPDGSLALHAFILGDDQKVIAKIDHNNFEINRNKILDSLSPPRKDKSTIAITDEDGNTMDVRYINPHSVAFAGRLYIRPSEFVQIDEHGFNVEPSSNGLSGPICVRLSGSGPGTFIGITP